MAAHAPTPYVRKTLAESAVCFGSILAGLAAAALALQWLMGLLA